MRKTLCIIVLSVGWAFVRGPIRAESVDWTITKILSKNAVPQVSEEAIIVRNCLIEEKKTRFCESTESASQNYKAEISVGAEAIYLPARFEARVNVAKEFQLEESKSSGESLELPTAPEGKAVIYVVKESYIKYVGKGLARSSKGEEKVVDYVVQSTCELSVIERTIIDCAELPETEKKILEGKMAAPIERIKFEDRILGDWIDDKGNLYLSLKSQLATDRSAQSHNALVEMARYTGEDPKGQAAIEACSVRLGFPPNSKLQTSEIKRVARVGEEKDGVYFAAFLPDNSDMGFIFTEAEKDSIWGGEVVRLLMIVFRSDDIVDVYILTELDGETFKVAGISTSVESACLAYGRLRRG